MEMPLHPSRPRLLRVLPVLLATLLLAVFTGCDSLPAIPVEDAYQPPAPGSGVATLQGTSINEEGLFGSEHRGFVSMVDLKPIPNAEDHRNDPLPLNPGKRTIAAEYRYSNFMTRAYLPFEAKAGVHYQLMIKSSRDNSPEARLYNDFWIVDLSTGRTVTPVYHQQVTGGKKGTIFYQNK